jgi:hypothetical protein
LPPSPIQTVAGHLAKPPSMRQKCEKKFHFSFRGYRIEPEFFIMEEDGSIATRVIKEYQGLE